MSPAPRGLAPREGLEFALVKMGRAGPPFEPRRRPQAGKSGDPRSQNADTFDYEIMQLLDTAGIPCVPSNITSNWVIIKMLYRYL